MTTNIFLFRFTPKVYTSNQFSELTEQKTSLRGHKMAYQNQICMNKNTSRRKRINTTIIVFFHPIVHYLFFKIFYLYDCLFIFFTLFISVSISHRTTNVVWPVFLYLDLSISGIALKCWALIIKKKVIDKNNEGIWKEDAFSVYYSSGIIFFIG